MTNNIFERDKKNTPAPAICVADWDGTLSSGYSILDWMGFLYQQKIISVEYYNCLKSQFASYYSAKITYEELVTSCGSLYANAVNHIKSSIVNELARFFAETYKTHLQIYFPNLIKLLASHKIKLAIISGAPIEVIRAQCASIPILTRIFALEVLIISGLYTNIVKTNYGTFSMKENALKSLGNSYQIVAGIGDTESDTPLFQYADIGLFLGGHDYAQKPANTFNVTPNTIISTLDYFLSKRG